MSPIYELSEGKIPYQKWRNRYKEWKRWHVHDTIKDGKTIKDGILTIKDGNTIKDGILTCVFIIFFESQTCYW